MALKYDLPPIDERDYYTTEEAAEVLGLNRSILQRMRYRGQGPAYRKFNAIIQYPKELLHAFFEASLVETQDQTVAQ